MKYLHKIYTNIYHKRNEEILEEPHVTTLEDKLCTYRHKWFQYVHRMEDNRLPNNFRIIIQKEDLDDHFSDY
jgi:glucose-6-phosphate isomerase